MSVMKTTRDVRGVGLSIPRADGAEKVTGRVPYVADISPRGLLHARMRTRASSVSTSAQHARCLACAPC